MEDWSTLLFLLEYLYETVDKYLLQKANYVKWLCIYKITLVYAKSK